MIGGGRSEVIIRWAKWLKLSRKSHVEVEGFSSAIVSVYVATAHPEVQFLAPHSFDKSPCELDLPGG